MREAGLAVLFLFGVAIFANQMWHLFMAKREDDDDDPT